MNIQSLLSEHLQHVEFSYKSCNKSCQCSSKRLDGELANYCWKKVCKWWLKHSSQFWKHICDEYNEHILYQIWKRPGRFFLRSLWRFCGGGNFRVRKHVVCFLLVPCTLTILNSCSNDMKCSNNRNDITMEESFAKLKENASRPKIKRRTQEDENNAGTTDTNRRFLNVQYLLKTMMTR